MSSWKSLADCIVRKGKGRGRGGKASRNVTLSNEVQWSYSHDQSGRLHKRPGCSGERPLPKRYTVPELSGTHLSLFSAPPSARKVSNAASRRQMCS